MSTLLIDLNAVDNRSGSNVTSSWQYIDQANTGLGIVGNVGYVAGWWLSSYRTVAPVMVNTSQAIYL